MPTPSYKARLEAAKRQSTLQLLFKAARLINDEGMARANGASVGFALRPAHFQLLPHIALDGSRTTEIAVAIGISKQAVGQLVSELERGGVVERVPDPSDGRAKLVRFTEAGRQGLLWGLGVLRALEAEYAAVVGEDEMAALNRTLAALVAEAERRRGAGGGELRPLGR